MNSFSTIIKFCFAATAIVIIFFSATRLLNPGTSDYAEDFNNYYVEYGAILARLATESTSESEPILLATLEEPYATEMGLENLQAAINSELARLNRNPVTLFRRPIDEDTFNGADLPGMSEQDIKQLNAQSHKAGAIISLIGPPLANVKLRVPLIVIAQWPESVSWAISNGIVRAAVIPRMTSSMTEHEDRFLVIDPSTLPPQG